MQKYKVIQPVTFHEGVRLRLNHQQAFIRMGHLERVEKEVYRVRNIARFRAGESVWAENVGDDAMSCLAPFDKPDKKKQPAGKKGKK